MYMTLFKNSFSSIHVRIVKSFILSVRWHWVYFSFKARKVVSSSTHRDIDMNTAHSFHPGTCGCYMNSPNKLQLWISEGMVWWCVLDKSYIGYMVRALNLNIYSNV